MSKLLSYRLTLDVDFDPQGTSAKRLERNLKQVIRDAVGNGTLTGETEATVEKYSFTVVARNDRQPGQHQFADCGGSPRCVTCGCDEDDAYVGGQDCTFGGGNPDVCKKCGSDLTEDGFCDDETCPYSDKQQDACPYCGSGLVKDGECQKCGL